MENGLPKTRPVEHLQMVHVFHAQERNQIDAAFNSFSVGLKHDLITHPSGSFFAYRVPRWQNIEKLSRNYCLIQPTDAAHLP